MTPIHVPPTDPNQALVERIVALERQAAEWQNGEVVCHPTENRDRIIHGTINTGGAFPASGPGWTATKPGTGGATITFTTPFSAAPEVFVTPNTDASSWRFGNINTARTASQVVIGITNNAAAPVDGNVSFVAIGPV